MCGDVEFGKCDSCGNEAPIKRKYYYYDIECSCCSSKHKGKNYHFEIKRHCANCEPSEPKTIKVYLDNMKPVHIQS